MDIYAPIQLSGKRLMISPLQSKHALVLWKQLANYSFEEIINTFKWFRWDISIPRSEQDMQSIVDRAIRGWEKKTRVPFAIKKQGQVIGSTSFLEISAYHKHVEIGITFLTPEHRRKGYNYEVTRLLLSYLFDTLHYERVQVKAATDNLPSQKSFLAIGFEKEGILRSFQTRPDLPTQRGDVVVFSLTRNDWSLLRDK